MSTGRAAAGPAFLKAAPRVVNDISTDGSGHMFTDSLSILEKRKEFWSGLWCEGSDTQLRNVAHSQLIPFERQFHELRAIFAKPVP